MAYREVYFRIDSAYQGNYGWTSAKDKVAFKEETRRLFQDAGWTLHVGERDCVCDTVTKGLQNLYLHPMNFSGVILENEIPAIEVLLAKATTIRWQATDRMAIYYEMTDDEYLKYLESRRDEIITAILEHCKTKRSNLYHVGDFTLGIADRFSVHRLCDVDGHRNRAYKYVSELVDQLINEGQLITANTKKGPGIRTATAKERKSRKAG